MIAGPPRGSYWRYSRERFKNRIATSESGGERVRSNVPAIKRFLSEVKAGTVPQTLWTYSEVGHTQEAKKDLLSVLQEQVTGDLFSTPKPVRLIERILQIATKPGDTPGTGGNFAYLRTRRIPMNRVVRRIDHPQVWLQLQLMHFASWSEAEAVASGRLFVGATGDRGGGLSDRAHARRC